VDSSDNIMVLGGVLLVLAAFSQRNVDQDGKPDRWTALVREQLAPEIKPLAETTEPYDRMEGVKALLDHTGEISPQFQKELSIDNLIPMGMIKSAMDFLQPNFKLPPGVSVPMAPGSGHMVLPLENGGYGIPNAEKNHISGIQRDAINAGAGTLRFQDTSRTSASFGTRQNEAHSRKPSYAFFLKNMMDRYATGFPGYGIGSVPLQVIQNVAPMNPLLPASPGPLGSGVDILGLRSAQMQKVIGKDTNLAQMQTFPPRLFHGHDNAFSMPAAVMNQFPNEMVNTIPQAALYATTIGASPMSGVQPWFA